jgi:acyl-[acyl carrier protein]--UDP-N-acetylglucosamine O-acyltransferase
MADAHGHDDVEARLAEIDPSAQVSSLAVIGAPGEWVGKDSTFPAVVRADAVIREFARVHAGCVRETVVGEGAFVMSGSYVAHDVVLGRLVHVAPSAVIGGLAEVGDYSRIGLGAVVLPHRKITKDVPDGQVWAGNPATYRKDTTRPIPE